MISTYNAAAQTVAVDGAFVFDTNRIVTGCTVGHTPGTTTFTLNKPGYYYVTFNTTFTTDATGEATVKIAVLSIAQQDGRTFTMVENAMDFVSPAVVIVSEPSAPGIAVPPFCSSTVASPVVVVVNVVLNVT